MIIRRYTDADWESIADIYNLSKPDELRDSVDPRAFLPLERDTRSQRLFRESRIVVVEDHEEILGFGGNTGNYISWMFVHPHHRRKGAARLLLEHILASLDGTIELNVFKNNHPARSLYQQFGFEIEREFVGNLNGYKTNAMTLRMDKRSQTNPSSRLQTSVRAAAPIMTEGRSFAYYLDQAADGFFRLMLGRRYAEVVAKAYIQPGHDLSYQHVTFAEHKSGIVGMFSGYTAEQHRHSSDRPLQEAAGWALARMMTVSFLFSPMLRFIETVPSGEFYLQAIAIEPEYRGKGVGSTLLNAAEEKGRAEGSHLFSLDVFIGNKGARSLYERRGMRVVSQWPKRLPIPGFKIFRMVKSL